MNIVSNYYRNMLQQIPFHDPVFIKILLGIAGLSIFALTVSVIYLFFSIREKKNIIWKLKKFNEDLIQEAVQSISKNKATKSFYEYIDLLLSRSQIKYTFCFEFWNFVIITILFFLFGLYSFIEITDQYLSALLAGIGVGFIPYVFLEVMASIKGRKIKNQILTLIPILINNAKLTSGDVFQTIKKSVPKTKEPMKIYLEEFVDEYESGVNIEKCFENLKNKVMDYRFTRLVDALETHLYKGGNVAVTLNSLQREYLAREIEEDRRKKETFTNVLGVYFVVVANFFIVYIMGKVMPEVLTELQGKDYKYNILFSVVSTLISLFIAFKATRVSKHKK